MKKIIFSALVVLGMQRGFAQTFMHGIGVATYIQAAPGFSTSVVGGLTYSPKVSFLETDNTSLSVGIPLSVGASGSYNYSTYGGGDNSLAVMLDIPLILNFNVGAGSSKEAESRFGFFVGGGFGYHTSSYTEEDEYGDSYSDKIAGFGPVGNAGVRIGVGRRSRNVEIRFSYMKTLDLSKSNVFGIGGIFNF